MENLLTNKSLDRFNEWAMEKYQLNYGRISGWPESAQNGLIKEFIDSETNLNTIIF